MPAASLTAVTLALKPFPAVSALEHVVSSISYFLDNSVMIPLAQACSFGSTRLLDQQSSRSEANIGTTWSLCQYLRSDVHYYRFQFTKSLRAAVELGDLEIVQWVLKHFSGCTAEENVVEEAARCGRLDILEYLLEYGRCYGDDQNVILWGGDDMANAIQEGHGEVAQWLYENIPDARRNLEYVMEFAVRHGDISLIQWLLDVVYMSELLLAPPSMSDAAAGGHMEILQWIFEQDFGGCCDYALERAAKNGRLDMVEWLVENGITKGAREAVQAACSEGHLRIVQWLLERGGVSYPHFAMNCAIHGGHLDIVKYLSEAGITYGSSRMMFDAASYGHMEVIEWLVEKYDTGLFPTIDSSRVVRSNQSAMDRAASNGHLHVLEFLHSLAMEMQHQGKSGGPTCSNWALMSASSNGHFDVVKWLCNTYPQMTFPSTTTGMVARNGNLEMLQWLHHQESIEWSTDAMDSAAENGHMAVVKWLHQNRMEGCTTSAMNYAARNGHLNIVRWLHLNFSEGCTVDAMDFAVNREHFEVLLFLRAKRTEGCSTSAKVFARGHQQRHVMEWLEDQYPETDAK
ncbi:Hypothetical protein PHPALM_10322 [Phytophthora palmivora]|uniref:Ankyrin repeat-containing domain n=1 Tax=Phytophthora palmivora TaxID=4796 RepID=A0A2P4Y517_9STRA|nr:Hypothetical protein PHPALM_10322 [Phytophthora palmivora]